MLYHMGDSWHTQNIQINKVIAESENVYFISQRKLNGLFGHSNVIVITGKPEVSANYK